MNWKIVATILAVIALAVAAICLYNPAEEKGSQTGDRVLNDGTVLSNDGLMLITAPVEAVNYTVPSGVKTVAAYAFFNCSDLQSITFPDSVTTMEPHAFDGLRIITLYVPYNAPYFSELPSFFNIIKTGLPEHTVTFNSNGGTAVEEQKVTDGEAVSKPADPTKENYVLYYWSKDGVEYDFSAPVTQNLTLNAEWYDKLIFTSSPKVRT